MLTILTNPIFRKIITSLIIGGIGFYGGFTLKQKQLQQQRKQKNIAIGKYEQLTVHYQQLRTVADTLQNVVIMLAKQERINVVNYVQNTKVKDGSTLNFVPKTHATLTALKISKTATLIPQNVFKPSAPVPILPEPIKKEKKRSWIRRVFTRKK